MIAATYTTQRAESGETDEHARGASMVSENVTGPFFGKDSGFWPKDTGLTYSSLTVQSTVLSDPSIAFPRATRGASSPVSRAVSTRRVLDEDRRATSDGHKPGGLSPRVRSQALSSRHSLFPDFWRKGRCVTSGLPLAAILRPRVCAPYLSWSARDLLSANPSPPRDPISTPTRYKKALDAGVGGGRERGREVPGRSETGRDRAEERKAMRRTGAPTQADSRGRGRARGGCPGGEATPSLPPPRGGTRGQEPQVPRGLRRVAGLGRPWLGRGRAGAGVGVGVGALTRRGVQPFFWASKEGRSCGGGIGKRVRFGLPRTGNLGAWRVGLGSRPRPV